MTAADHARHAAAGEPGGDMEARPADLEPPQLRELTAAITASGRFVREELVLDELLADLRVAAEHRPRGDRFAVAGRAASR